MELGLTGWVRNTPAGVELELQGADDGLDMFICRLQAELPPLAVMDECSVSGMPENRGEEGFAILPSTDGRRQAHIAPDSAICADCLRELFDPADRRYQHPFISCTNCGPRWTIVTGIPYDRPLTTMAVFPLCQACLSQYKNPSDRRFHAQPVSCHQCGPRLSLVPESADPLVDAVDLLKQGSIVAIKGLGGYHLAVDATSDTAVERLRRRKLRDEKPFAVMVPDIDAAREVAFLSGMEERMLCGAEAPIVIVRSRADSPISRLVAPGSGWIGLLLPYTPLHQLLFAGSGLQALVMTSANPSDEPMLSGDDDALKRLSGIADGFLRHNRPISVRTDDSVVRVFQGKPLFYRRSRGYVPRAVRIPFDAGEILAVGGELKNTFCLTRGNEAFVSQHIGDLKNEATLDNFRLSIRHMKEILEISPTAFASDLHPDYLSTREAQEFSSRYGLPLVMVQHHHAHMASCMAENLLDGEVIGVVFDGSGLGDDGTTWGGEFLVGGYAKVRRAGHLRHVRLPGGDAAAREPWRMAVAWIYNAIGDLIWEMESGWLPPLSDMERSALKAMLDRGLNAPLTSSAGRLFDAAAAMLCGAVRNSFDGQAGMALEALAESAGSMASLPRPEIINMSGAIFQIDCAGMLHAINELSGRGFEAAPLALGFHKGVADAVHAGCDLIRRETGLCRVVLSGGVFQNRLLTEMVYHGLLERGFSVFMHRLLPPNDGGLALGQATIAARRL